MGARKCRARVFAITSGKGGVGKTNLSVNLAIAMARLGRRVVLIDVDIGLANADVLLNVNPRFHLGHVLGGEVAPLDALLRTDSGVWILPGSNGTVTFSDLEDYERRFLIESFRQFEEYADYILIDTGAGISSNVVQFARSADEIIVVTTPEPTAITDGYAMIKTVSREKGAGRIRLVVNQAADRIEAGRVSERIRMVSKRFLGVDVDNLGHILTDDRVRKCVRRRRPFVQECPRAPASIGVRQICDRLLSERADDEVGRFYRRFADALEGGRN